MTFEPNISLDYIEEGNKDAILAGTRIKDISH